MGKIHGFLQMFRFQFQVKLRIACDDETWWEAKSCTKENSADPEWMPDRGHWGLGMVGVLRTSSPTGNAGI